MPSENGWEPARANGATQCRWVNIPGTNVTLQLLKGWPLEVMRAYAADYNAYIEPLRDADSASYTPTNSVATSNHLNATAMDLNWNTHPFRVNYAGFDAAMIARMRDMLAFYNFEGLQIMFWAQDWNTPKDTMHHQMGYGTYGDQRVQRFIDARIRPDGFSTYKRGGSGGGGAPVETGLTAHTLARAMGGSVSMTRYEALLPAVREALTLCGCGSLNRVAMWMAQIGHESAGLKYMEEIASGSAYEGRRDLGNIYPGDGVKFKGHGPIQITGRHNHQKVSEWAFGKGLVPTATYFVEHPDLLATDKYGFLGVVWYWTVARPNINSMADAGDLEGVTRAINGGLNGLADRRTRWDRARNMGWAALNVEGGSPPPPTQEDDMSAEAERKIDVIYQELTKRFKSRSPVRHLDDSYSETLAGYVLNADGNEHLDTVRLLAGYGHPRTLTLLREVASAAGDPRYPDRQDDALLARAILAEAGKEPEVSVVPKPMAVAPTPVAPPAPMPQYREQFVEPSGPTAKSTGQVLGQAYDALEALQLSGALGDEERAPLTALIAVLQTKVGE